MMNRVFLEGLPGAGKSTTLNSLARLGVPVTRELGSVLEPTMFPGDGKSVQEVLAIDEWFIGQEKSRMYNTEGVFDRSYFTHLTYSHGYANYTGLASFHPTIDRYGRALKESELAIPSALVILEVEPELSIERQNQREADGAQPLANFWKDKHFLGDLAFAYKALCDSLTGIPVLIEDGSQKVSRTAANIKDLYQNMSAELNVQNRSIDLGRYALKLSL